MTEFAGKGENMHRWVLVKQPHLYFAVISLIWIINNFIKENIHIDHNRLNIFVEQIKTIN